MDHNQRQKLVFDLVSEAVKRLANQPSTHTIRRLVIGDFAAQIVHRWEQDLQDDRSSIVAYIYDPPENNELRMFFSTDDIKVVRKSDVS